jgi:[ribosomal protein S5]-alanine N-acetyltransferase
MTVIHTRRLTLRPASADDLDALHAIMRQPQAMAYWSTPPHEHPDKTADFLAGMMTIPPDLGEDFIAEHEGRLIGKVGLYRFPELGYLFDPEVWGNGFASEAVAAVMTRAFEVHSLLRLTADVDPRNDASIRLLERLGFSETHREARTWLVGGQWCDSVYFALEREAWSALQRTA